jgi:2-polyprenyl-6-methoxyphenol hydroxylase-like FAD-dependent oxidoreductase
MQIFVETLTGKLWPFQVFEMATDCRSGKTIAFEVDSADTVANVKAKIHANADLPLSLKGLVFAGRHLEDTQPLSEYLIPAGAKLHEASVSSAAAGDPKANSSPRQSYDVLIVGAGPVGLFLACELGLAGVSVLVLEKEAQASSLWKEKPLGRRGVNSVSVEAFYRRGLLEKLFDPEKPRPATFQKTATFQFAGHFAGMKLDANKLDLSRWKYRLPGPALLPGPTDLARVEAILVERAGRLGVPILRGANITRVAEESDSVVAHTADAQSFHAKWLVGCDGGRSMVRRVAGFEFTGTDAELIGYTALCDLKNPAKLKPGFQLTPSGLYIVADTRHVIAMDFDSTDFDRSQPVSREHFESVLRRVSGTDVEVSTLELASTFTDRSKQTTTYRRGRILLAGDSAHIHSPLGAQGLNTGIGDAINLGWKLAATVKGTAPTDLLDTYTQERHPVAASVLAWTRVQVATMRPNLHGAATADLIRTLLNTTDGANYFIDRFWGLSTPHYPIGDHPLAGASAPDFEFSDGSRLGPKMESGRGLVVDFASNASLKELTRAWASRVDYIDARPKDTVGLQALLIRPDGVVAWIAEEHSVPDIESLGLAVLRWFGPA